MISIDEAIRKILEVARPAPVSEVSAAEALGLILAEQITSDIDSPPHDKSLVDGYALEAGCAQRGAELLVIEEVSAGAVPTRTVQAGTATRIMTGAPIPTGADAVVMAERTEPLTEGSAEADRIRILQPPSVGQNIMPRGASLRRHQIVLVPGKPLRAVEIGLLSEVGRTSVKVVPPPQVSVLVTGNELVPADHVPAAGQIRNSNGPMLETLVRQARAVPRVLGIGRDDTSQLREMIRRGLDDDVLLLSGGVSAGKFDLVPPVLAELGVKKVFHKVDLRPGKPLWFGVYEKRDAVTLVFGLPGNPVSTLVCFECFVRPALNQIAGYREARPAPRRARLSDAHEHRDDRPTFYPCRADYASDPPAVWPLAWQGSADLRTLTDANCLAFFPGNRSQYHAGDPVDIYEL